MKRVFQSFAIFGLFFGATIYGSQFFNERIFSGSILEATAFPEKPVENALPHRILDRAEEEKTKLLSSNRKFLEINLEEMGVRVFENGAVITELPILKKGDPYEWGGTASGIYNVLSKQKLAYSAVAEVYMPYTIGIYGKYFLHGEPYYPDGSPLVSDVSGGCVQMRDEDIKVVYDLVETKIPLLVVDKKNDGFHYSFRKENPAPEVSAKSYLIADLDSGFVFSEKNPSDLRPIASLTKLMTATVVAEQIDLRKAVFATEEALENGFGATEDLNAGEEYRLVELLYPLLTESSNDAAEVLTLFLGRNWAINLMNSKAKGIYMENTRFSDPSGYDPGNVSTAEDLFYLGRYIFNNRPLFLKISKGQNVRAFGEVRFEDLKNKNVFYDDPEFVGGKTGFIISSDYNGLFIFKIPYQNSYRNIIVIMLGSEAYQQGEKSLEKETEALVSWVEENYFINP